MIKQNVFFQKILKETTFTFEIETQSRTFGHKIFTTTVQRVLCDLPREN
jgi:hypothetical protein